MKTIAMYLPQFHRTAENDEWWGIGFTEWTAVKGASSIYNGHNQPREPLNDNYYNLLDKSIMRWQAELAKTYEVYGFCFYHYWFENGRRILEKPAENLLKWKDIDMPFCFSWANESWIRSWSNVRGGNVWSDLYDGNNKDGSGILLNQAYGDVNDWKKHFDYLLPFFNDDRYIKICGKPVFIIYRPDLVPRYCLENMLNNFRNLAKNNGFPDLYLISADLKCEDDSIFDGYIATEPKSAFAQLKTSDISTNNSMLTNDYSYDDLWKCILSNCSIKKDTYLCGVVDYDETPRKGKNGTHLSDVSVEKFKHYFKLMVEQSLKAGNDIVFLNAWNEWGEGMYLEPDKKNTYGFLEAVREVMVHANESGKTTDYKVQNKDFNNVLMQKNMKINKFINYFDVLNVWLSIRQENKTLESYFLKMNFNNIAIYGIGVLGKHLYEELQGSRINVSYAIDKYITKSFIRVFSLRDSLPEVDVIVVTPTFEYSKIEEQLYNVGLCSVVSLEKIVNEVMQY